MLPSSIGAVNLVAGLVILLSSIYFLYLPSGGFEGGRNAARDPGFLFSRTTWDLIHTWSAVTFIGAVVLHFWIHWGWVSKVTSRLLAPRRRQSTASSSAPESGR